VIGVAADLGQIGDTVLLVIVLGWIVGWVALGAVRANRAAKIAWLGVITIGFSTVVASCRRPSSIDQNDHGPLRRPCA
jgi:hypothetical protein